MQSHGNRRAATELLLAPSQKLGIQSATCIAWAQCNGTIFGHAARSVAAMDGPSLEVDVPALRDAVQVLHALGGHRLLLCSNKIQQRAVVLLRCTRRYDVTLHWVRLQQLQQWKRCPGLAKWYDAQSLRGWERKWGDHAEVRRMIADPLDARRQVLHLFAAEFETHCVIHRLHTLGLRVPPTYVVGQYLKALSRRQLSVSTQAHMARLRERAVTAKQWSRAFRSRWSLEWGAGHVQHGVSSSATKQRAVVFFRWLFFVLHELTGGPHPLVINMDETMLSSVRPWKLGVVPSAHQAVAANLGTVPRDSALPRTSLLAAVCSDAALQKYLPQVRLPRARPETPAGPTVLAAYAAAGAPQAAYHGGSGWNTGAIMVSYLRDLTRRLARVAPGRPLILVMDDSGIHTGDSTLRECIRLRIAVVIIPSRMTWCLQPLDTHVFARLKAAIRGAVFERMAGGLGGRVSPSDRIRLHGEAIRSVLVERDWSEVVRRGGLDGPGHVLRPAVLELLSGADVTPRFPSAEDLQRSLNVPDSRAQRLLDALNATWRRAVPQPAAAAAAESQPVDAASLAAAEHLLPLPRLRLRSSARLPSAPRRADLPVNFMLVQPTRSPVVTRSHTSALLRAGGSAAASAAEVPPPPKTRRRR